MRAAVRAVPIEAQIAVHLLAVRMARIRRLVLKLLEQRAMKMPNLQAVGAELAKLQSEAEDDARKFIDGIAATRARKNATFERATQQRESINASLTDVNGFLDDLDKATNGPPSSGDSPGSPVSAQPSETAGLGAVKAT